MGGSLSWEVTSLPIMVAIGTVVVEICFRLSYDLTSQRDRRVMSHVTFWTGTHQDKLLSCQVWWP